MRPLTQAEKRILELVGQGLSSVEIGFNLGMSKHTVETHRKSLLLKFDAKNAAELVKKAMKSKLMSAGKETESKPNHYEDDL